MAVNFEKNTDGGDGVNDSTGATWQATPTLLLTTWTSTRTPMTSCMCGRSVYVDSDGVAWTTSSTKIHTMTALTRKRPTVTAS